MHARENAWIVQLLKQRFDAGMAVARPRLLYITAADLENRGNATFTLRGVNVTGLPVAYPGAPVRGVQFGTIERF